MVLCRLLLVRRLAQTQQRRLLSAGETFSYYQYPLATQAPQITKTTAAEAQTTVSVTLPSSSSSDAVRDPADRFDDSQTLSDFEKESILSAQKQHIQTAVLGSTKIGLQVPAYIPANVPAAALKVPETMITTLENGVKVVSQETYSQMCAIGILGGFGSRHETTPGTAHLLELMAYQSTASYPDSVHIQQKLQDWGATCYANSGREQTLWCLDLLRPNVEQGMDLLKQVILEPMLLDSEIEDSKRAMHFQAEDIMPEVQIGEALQMAAYGEDQQLGKPHFGKRGRVHVVTISCPASNACHHCSS
jgi:Insulinase (Peptidase family M16)